MEIEMSTENEVMFECENCGDLMEDDGHNCPNCGCGDPPREVEIENFDKGLK